MRSGETRVRGAPILTVETVSHLHPGPLQAQPRAGRGALLWGNKLSGSENWLQTDPVIGSAGTASSNRGPKNPDQSTL